jgi:hypothetical protein
MAQIPNNGKGKRIRKLTLRDALIAELRAAGAEGMTIEAIYLEFSEYAQKSIHAQLYSLNAVSYNVKRVPYGRSGNGNPLSRFILMPPKKIEIK